MKLQHILLLLSVTLLCSGCVVGRRTVGLTVPAMSSASGERGSACVLSVTDNRKFENKPSEPSTPSIDGDVTKMSATQREGMIGRQRNGYGKAMGDIALPAGDSVSKRAQLLVEEALKRRGYSLTSDKAAPTAVSVSVDEFWAWFSPGMWSVSFESRVYCTLTFKRADSAATVTVRGYGLNRGQVAKDANWQLAYDRAFQDFLAKFGPELDKTTF